MKPNLKLYCGTRQKLKLKKILLKHETCKLLTSVSLFSGFYTRISGTGCSDHSDFV